MVNKVNENSTDGQPRVLDLVQLMRIRAVHRGFLYQHLQAVGCILRMTAIGATAVSIEPDEDVEVAFPDRRVYLQIKTTTSQIERRDVRSALARFDKIRAAHASGERTGTAVYRIVANAAPSAVLRSDQESGAWSQDVEMIWPGRPAAAYDGLPPPWPDVTAAIAWCVEVAAAIPFSTIAPETLVLKLAALVLFAATGDDQERPEHTFEATQVPALLEQLVEQLQEFPQVPLDYRPQFKEPAIDVGPRVRLVVGFSGAGKSTWAAHAARHCPEAVVYFDVADLPGPALASALSRELAAALLGKREATALPASSGLQLLSALNQRLPEDSKSIVVVDNAHRVAAQDISSLTQAASRLRFVLLAQPVAITQEMAVRLQVEPETLSGWSSDEVAAEFAALGCAIDPATAERWRVIAAGMPLFVRSAAQITAALYNGDAAESVEDFEKRTHLASTAQELILSQVVDTLSEQSKTALAILSVSTVPLTRAEMYQLLEAAPGTRESWSMALRALAATGALQIFAGGDCKIHDAIHPLARALQPMLSTDTIDVVRVALRELLRTR